MWSRAENPRRGRGKGWKGQQQWGVGSETKASMGMARTKEEVRGWRRRSRGGPPVGDVGKAEGSSRPSSHTQS